MADTLDLRSSALCIIGSSPIIPTHFTFITTLLYTMKIIYKLQAYIDYLICNETDQTYPSKSKCFSFFPSKSMQVSFMEEGLGISHDIASSLQEKFQSSMDDIDFPVGGYVAAEIKIDRHIYRFVISSFECIENEEDFLKCWR